MMSGNGHARRDERKIVTILFADLVGSTELAEGLDPERLQALLHAYFAAMATIIERWGGTIEKYIGDAIMAVFGVPRAHEDDPRRAVGAALDMLADVERLNLGFRERHGVELRIRIGVNTGEVLAPVGGPAEQMLVVGDAVNVAARLEQAADPGTVLVGERTHVATRVDFEYETPRHLELKGKSRPVPAWRALGSALVERPAPFAAPILGRDRERRAIAEALAGAVESGMPRTVVVFGGAGIGKSRLVREALDAAARERPALTVMRGRCIAAGNGITYWALGEIVREAFDIALDAAPEEAAERLELGMRRDLERSTTSEEDVRRTIYAFATSAGIRLPDNPLDLLRPATVSQELAQAWRRYLSARAASQPLIVLVEDLHWADEELLAILDAIRSRSSGPILLVATARPEFQENHVGFAVAQEGTASVALAPLGAADAGGVLDHLGGTALPDRLRRDVLDRADGNPFFLEQLVGGLVDSGVLERHGDAWAFAGDAATVVLPDTIHAVVAARIDRLEPGEKLLLQEAAVVGRAFWPGALEGALDAIPQGLSALEARGLVTVRASSALVDEVEYAFRHALILDVAYASVPMGRRARSHAAVAAWLAGRTIRDDEGVAELIAHHYRSALLGPGADLAWADLPEEREVVRAAAVPALIAAGALARRRNLIDRAVELHEAALELAATDTERAVIHEELGDDHGWGYHGDPSVAAWKDAIRLRQQLGDGEGVARNAVKIARATTLYYGAFEHRPTGASIDAYLDLGLAQEASRDVRAWLLMLRGRATESWAADALPDPVPIAERLAAAEEATAMARDVGDPTLRIHVLRTIAGIHVQSGEAFDPHALAAEQAEAGIGAAGRDRILVALQMGALVADVAGDFQAAIDVFRDSYERAREFSPHERMHTTYFLMAALYRLARWDDIEPYAMEHIRTFDEETVDIDCPYTRSGPVVAALALERLGRMEAAAEAERRIVPNWERPGVVEAWVAERQLRRGDVTAAWDTAQRVRAFGRLPSIDEAPYELPVLVEAAGTAGIDAAAADDVIDAARGSSSRVIWISAAIDRTIGRRAAAVGDVAAAREALERSLALYRRLAMADDAARVEADLVAVSAPA
jgi:class 3 adenylate cyclase/tetratricopeptide (TPR) repeat protein